jgi:hypothetical protein
LNNQLLESHLDAGCEAYADKFIIAQKQENTTVFVCVFGGFDVIRVGVDRLETLMNGSLF